MNVNYCLRTAKRYHGRSIAILHGDQQISYAQFYDEVENSARKLAALGASKGERVAVLLQNSPEYLDLYYSTARAGALIVPLNTRWHVNEIIYTLNDSGSKILFVDERFLALVPQIRAEATTLNHIVYAGAGDCPDGLVDWKTVDKTGVLPHEDPDENDLVGLFYTSGTTGGPKGAMLTHRNVYSNALHSLTPSVDFITDGRFLHSAPMFHLADAGAIHALTLSGMTHCFLHSFDPGETLCLIEHYRITNLVLVPTMLNLVLNHPDFARYDLSSLKRVTYGASPMPLPLLKLAMQKLACEFAQGYGMTEVSPLLTFLLPQHHKLEDTDRPFAPVKSAGKPIIGVEVRVVDNDDREVPTGQVGEIIARGPNIMKGYWNRPEVNAEVLRGGWMHTGDLGAMDEEGFLYVLDRKKDMIKTGGENVYSPEVESVLCAHPAVLEASVIGVPHERWGETIRAVAVTRPGIPLSETELIEWCRARLTHFKCPTSAVFTDVLPKGGTGKVQKNLLRERFSDSRSSAFIRGK